MKRQMRSRAVTSEEYLAYKALKEDGVPIKGYETPSRQFNTVSKVSYVGEAIDLILKDRNVDTLANALGTFDLEDDVKSSLENEVIRSIIELGKNTWRTGGGGFVSHLVTEYKPTFEFLQSARKYSSTFPKIAEGIGKFLLHDENNPSPEYEKGWYLDPINVDYGIEFLLDSGKPFSEVALEVRNATKGKRGSSHTIERYVQGILPNKDNQDEKKRPVYSYLSYIMEDLLTPELFDDALKELKLSSKEREKNGKGIGGTFYADLMSMKKEIDSGEYETINERQYNTESLETKRAWTIRELNYKIDGIESKKDKTNDTIKRFNSEQISNINLALKDLESYLGEIKFNSIGYNKVKENISSLTEEMNVMRDYVNEKWSSIEKGLIDRRDELKRPWYKKIF